MTQSGRDGSRVERSVGHPGPRWGVNDPDFLHATDGVADASDAPPPAEASAGPPPPEVRREKPPRVRPEDATLWRRLGAFLIDELARFLFYPLLMVVLVLFGGQIPDPVSPGDFSAGVIIPQLVLRAGLSWTFWSHGTSPGAMLLHLRLVDAHGNAPGSARGGVRATVEIVSVFVPLGFAWALFSRRRQTWHDLASGVYVINAPREELDDTPR